MESLFSEYVGLLSQELINDEFIDVLEQLLERTPKEIVGLLNFLPVFNSITNLTPKITGFLARISATPKVRELLEASQFIGQNFNFKKIFCYEKSIQANIITMLNNC